MAKVKRLDAKNIDNIVRAKTDRDFMERLLADNEKLIWHSIKSFVGSELTEKDDLFQVASIGFFKAVKDFDISFGTCFSTYAVPKILGEVRRYVRDNCHVIKVPRDAAWIAHKAYQLFLEGHTQQEIVDILDVPMEAIQRAINTRVRSFEEVSWKNNSDDPPTLGDLITSDTNVEEDALVNVMIDNILDGLSARDKIIFEQRFLNDRTQREISREVGISQVQVSRRIRAFIKGCARMVV